MNTYNNICIYNNYSFNISSDELITNKIFTIIYNVKDESNKTKRLKINQGE